MNNQLISDEFGMSFQVKADSAEIQGNDCVETNARSLTKIASMLRTSLGPNGMDKIIVDCDNRITMTNDGATIVKEYVANNKGCVMELIKQLSESQDVEIGDGTTSVIIFANRLLQEAIKVLKLGMHPVKVTEGLSRALNYAIEDLKNHFSDKIENKKEFCTKAVETALNSKIASVYDDIKNVCVDAVLSVADLERKDVDLDRINVKTIKGGNINQTELLKGVLLEKEMVGEITTGKKKICLLACPFEPPKLKTKNKMMVSTAEEYLNLSDYEKNTFKKMIEKVKDSGAELVLCQWGFDDEATSMLLEHNLPAVRWVGGHDLGHIAALINAKIVSRFENLDSSCLGEGEVKMISSSTKNTPFIQITSDKNTIATIVIKSANKFVSEELDRSIRDALCAARNILIAEKISYGGGSVEINLYKKMFNDNEILELMTAEDVSCFQAFGNALLEIPIVLAENAGYDTKYIEDLLVSSGKGHPGVANSDSKTNDMKTLGVFESIESKTRQLTMACDFVNTILKISEVIRQQ